MYVYRSTSDGVYYSVELVDDSYIAEEGEILAESAEYYALPFKMLDGGPVKCDIPILGSMVQLSYHRNIKIASLRAACQSTIVAGADIELSDGTTEHFNFSDIDQSNIKQLWDAVKGGATAYPYQSDSGSCKVYKAADIAKIYIVMSTTITSNLTYYHQLKDYVNSLESASDIESVTWGQELTGAYLEHYNAMMAEANSQMNEIVRKAGDTT